MSAVKTNPTVAATVAAATEEPQPHLLLNRETLIKAIRTVMPAVTGKTTIPILSNIMLKADGGTLTLTATNLEIGIIHRIPAEGILTTVIPARQTLNMLQSMPKGAEVNIETKTGFKVRFISGRSSAQIEGMSAESFPELPPAPATLSELPAKALKRMIRQTEKSISMEESRFTLNGPQLSVVDGTMRLAATDGHRLHVASEPGVDGAIVAQVPKKAMMIAAQLCGKNPVSFSLDQNHCFFTSGETTLISRLLTGKFPDCDKVLNIPSPNECVIQVEAMIAALKIVEVFADKRSRAVRINLYAGVCTLSSQALEMGQSTASFDCDWTGDEYEAVLNCEYVLDILRGAVGPTVLFRFSDPKSQVEFAEPGYRAVVMPMRI